MPKVLTQADLKRRREDAHRRSEEAIKRGEEERRLAIEIMGRLKQTSPKLPADDVSKFGAALGLSPPAFPGADAGTGMEPFRSPNAMPPAGKRPRHPCGRRSSALTRAMRCDAARSCRVRASSRSVLTILRCPPRSRGQALRCTPLARTRTSRRRVATFWPRPEPSFQTGRPRRPRAGLILCRGGPLKQYYYRRCSNH